LKKITIKLATLGQMPYDFDPASVAKWKSSVFQVNPVVESYQLNEDAEGEDWQYTDQQLEKYLNGDMDEDYFVILVSVPLELDWYVRRLKNDRLIFTFHEMADILRHQQLPLENIVLRVLYASCLIYRRYGNRIPLGSENTDYAHDETRGCLFDMNASKFDVVHSCHEPCVCQACLSALAANQVSDQFIASVQRDIKKIKKPLFSRVVDFVRLHPIWSTFLSLITAFVVGISSSVMGSYLFEYIKS
jgi:hypothetical protein